MRLKPILLAFSVLAAPAPIRAQHPDPPSISILVHSTGGAPVPNASIQVDSAPLTLHTAQDGMASITPAVQTLRFHITAPGFEAKQIEVGLFSKIDIALAPAKDAQGPGAGQLALLAGQERDMAPAEFAALPHRQITVENGHTHMKETYSGVRLIDLLAPLGAPADSAVKGRALSDYIVATGSDGYKAVLALAEIEGGFHPGEVLVADAVDGKPLDAKEGPWKLVVSEDAKPARSVHNLVRVELRQAE